MSPMTATNTSAASVACGQQAQHRRRGTARRAPRAPTVTSDASCERAPAPWLTALCENPPAAGSVWKNDAERCSRHRSRGAPDCCRSAARRACGCRGRPPRTRGTPSRRSRARRAASADDVRERRQRRRRESLRHRRDELDARLLEPANATSRMPAATTTSGPGTRGSEPLDHEQHGDRRRRQQRRSARFAPRQRLDARRRASGRTRGPRSSSVSPSSFGSWPTATVAPTPIWMPDDRRPAMMFSTSEPSLQQPGDEQDHADEQRERHQVARSGRRSPRRRPPTRASSP